ncbi:MAG: hypothetical protein HUJ22_04665 [Gracilimonas sp.]|uniref:protein kinase domain-containing protein n=1 Tax=Gracilimonas sp. TaxID=1974203 RepID=UPI0019C24645|nr:protein kinase [Gracilimonas sp.]MBD3615845.1 hypothetical protein [Gracilimonas sp.]
MKKQYGKWKVEKTLKHDRCYLASSDDQKGVIKIGRNIAKEVLALKLVHDHANIVTLLDYDLEAEEPYLVTEFFEDSLQMHLYRPHNFNVSEITDAILNICEGITHCLSKGICPIDVQFLSNQKLEVRLVDFECPMIMESIDDMRQGLSLVEKKISLFENSVFRSNGRRRQKEELLTKNI